MIQIKFHIQSDDSTKVKKIQFCNTSEKNLDILYGIAKDSIQRKEKSNIDQLMIICSYHIATEIREKTTVEIIQKKLLEELHKHQSVVRILNGIKNLYIEAKIDDIPKKVLGFTSKNRDFIPILVELQALR